MQVFRQKLFQFGFIKQNEAGLDKKKKKNRRKSKDLLTGFLNGTFFLFMLNISI